MKPPGRGQQGRFGSACAARVVLVAGILLLWSRPAASETPRPSLFLSCAQDCHLDYLRQELSYFDVARDPHLARFVVVISRQPAGNGGERFTVSIKAQPPSDPRRWAPQSFVVPNGDPPHETRRLLLQAILRTLHVELAGTPHEAAFEIDLPRRDGAALSALGDPWDYWVIAPEFQGEGEGGSGYHFLDLGGLLTVRRITEESKIRVRGSYFRKLSGFKLEDGSRVSGDVYSVRGQALYAHSIGRHWALGGIATALADEFANMKHHVHGGPLLELNVFPYSESPHQQLRFAYQAGAWVNGYLEPNVEAKMREVRPYHALSVIADANQSWGSVQWIGQVNSFIDRPKQFRLATGASINWRPFEGFAFGLEGEAAWVRDQINLRGRQVTDTELLLWTVEQPTDYTFGFGWSLSYTFGSVHNTIVNPRFARVDLEEE